MRRTLTALLVVAGGLVLMLSAVRVEAVPGPRRLPAQDAAPPAAPRRRATWAGALLWLVASRAIAAFALVLVAALGVAHAAGFRAMTVMSDSMAPAVRTGDVVVNRPIAPLDARVGDVVTFRDPGGEDRLVTHRVRSVGARGGRVLLVTKGDANTAGERWTAPQSGHIGRVEYRLPAVGYVLSRVRGPHARLLLLTVPALILGALLLVEIWRPRRGRESGAAPA